MMLQMKPMMIPVLHTLWALYDFKRFQHVWTVLDIGCGFGSFGAHLLSLKVMAVCMVAYELTGSQVQLSLERGLPAVIRNFISKKLPFPSLSYDMIHYAQCGVQWDKKGNLKQLKGWSATLSDI